ncbi:TetR/AcrR family transcriptional regulator [Bradyrhizobium sediminis]|uniref:TetR/AcrR family transcriptional regulator n=1 Tax=Bradyrhizobium sediminis TaxID=2840469 RepID=A0A975RQM1_9BRAD|nr:TetR/AcrR family transcriptional regulator [Bradyrhizobium sediminis]QWG15796.1 TetR/AcrR family transcriptional regulator [Bradyrhizobium sediminis]
MDELAEKGLAGLSIGAIAARSGVHPTSIYRRWHTVEHLGVDAALAAAAMHVEIPDTGSLRGDLSVFLGQLEAHVRSPLGRALLAISGVSDAAAEARKVFWRERVGLAKVMFERAAARAEIAEGTDPVSALEFAIAPIYLRAVMLRQPADDREISRQTDWVMRAFAVPTQSPEHTTATSSTRPHS